MNQLAALRSPPGHPLLGHLPEFGRDQLGSLTTWSREYGDVVPIRFGPIRAVLLSDPSAIEDVLVRQARAFRKTPALQVLAPVLGNGLFISEGDFWLRQRRLAQPAFHRDRMAGYGETMVRFAEEATRGWSDGEVRDLRAEMVGLTLRIVAKTLFDSEVDADIATLHRGMQITSAHFQSRLNSLLFLIPYWVPTPGNRRMRTAVRDLEAIVYRIIAERRSAPRDRGDLLSMLLAAQDGDGSRMTDRQLRDELLTLLVAGHDTTALTLTWAWYLLARNPEVDRTMRAEIRAVVGDRPPTVADIPDLKYTAHVVNEVLRLFPAGYATGRQALEDVQIAGRRIAKGTVVLMSQWTVQRDPRYFEDPETFRPERWGGSALERLPRGAFFPFSMGPRQCIGASFATLETVLVLATIARRSRFTLIDDAEVPPVPSVSLQPGQPIKVRLSAA